MPVGEPLPLALYVHFPWCVRKCPYCDFNSHARPQQLPESAYIEALLADLDSQQAAAAGRELASIFLGGGTPSLIAPAAIARLLAGVRARLEIARDAEITLEANPGTIERGRFADYRDAGITRVSLGAQSFDAGQLQTLGRIHAAEDTVAAVGELRAAGIVNFNLDLMYALPGQSAPAAVADLEAAIALAPTHLSHYQLTLEPGTVFGGRPPPDMPDPDTAAEIQSCCQQRLAGAGYVQYEVSAYARAGARCRHNLNYWEFGDYLGIGAGAHGKWSTWQGGTLQIDRSAREREPRRYLAQLAGAYPPPPVPRPVAEADRAFEYMMNALRLVAGFAPADFEARTGLSFLALQAPLERARARGLIEEHAGHWRASERGFSFLNDLIGEFLPDAAQGLHRNGLAAAASGFYTQRAGAASTN